MAGWTMVIGVSEVVRGLGIEHFASVGIDDFFSVLDGIPIDDSLLRHV